MPALPKIPRMGNVDWERMLPLQRKSPATSTLKRLRNDLSHKMTMHGADEATQVVPPGYVRDRMQEIDEGNAEQQIGGAIGATGGGLLGAGAGALLTGLAKGKKGAKWGLLGGIPGAITGYGVGRQGVADRQLLTMLQEELGPGAGIKRAYVEEGFDEVLNELHKEKKKGTFNFGSLKGAVKDLKEGRGRNLLPSERLLFRKHLLGQKAPLPEDAAPWVPRQNAKPKVPKLPKPASIPKMKKPSVPKIPGRRMHPAAIAGGLAALAALGIGAASFWPRAKDSLLQD